MIDCQVAIEPLGWYLTFPSNPRAGLVFFTDSEKTDFVTSCGIDLNGESPLLVDLDEIEQCPTHWYEEACNFRPPF